MHTGENILKMEAVSISGCHSPFLVYRVQAKIKTNKTVKILNQLMLSYLNL
jgi:hypothetical protein